MIAILAQMRASDGEVGVYLVAALLIGAFVFTLAVVFLRWIFRINAIVAQLEESNVILGKILTRIEGRQEFFPSTPPRS